MRLFGRLSALFAAAAFFCLADGLYSAVSQGYESLDILPGQTVMVYGPSPLTNPLDSDLRAQITPATSSDQEEGAPAGPYSRPSADNSLNFAFESFFPSYWLGSAMWRGAVRAAPDARPGGHELLIQFRGIPAKGAQKFSITVWESEEAKQAGAASLIRRQTGMGPETPGVACGVLALALGFLTSLWGRRYVKTLTSRGCSEIFRVIPGQDGLRAFCFANGLPPPPEGNACRVFTSRGEELEPACMLTAVKGVLEFNLPADARGTAGSLVELKRPTTT